MPFNTRAYRHYNMLLTHDREQRAYSRFCSYHRKKFNLSVVCLFQVYDYLILSEFETCYYLPY